MLSASTMSVHHHKDELQTGCELTAAADDDDDDDDDNNCRCRLR